ncbi:MAG: metal-dependent hydrolase [Candidatus Heimdallarchaeaceae archaeon]
MTYTFTHLALQGLIVWLLLSKENREYYKEHRWEFLLINIFAILPDIDLLIGTHRSYTHSIIPPAFVLLSLIVISLINKRTNSFDERGKRIVRFFKLAAIMWLVHIGLDLGWDPILLFWPIDTNFYELSVYLRFENQPWLFFPLSFLGIIPDWRIYSFQEGAGMFIVDLTQAERSLYIGNYWDLPIEQFGLHLLIMITWLVVLVLPAFKKKQKQKQKKRKERSIKARKILKITWKRITKQLTLIGFFFIGIGLLLGPIIGRERLVSYQVASDYVNTQNYFDPTLGLVFTNRPQSTTELIFQSEYGLTPYNTTIAITDNNTFFSFFDAFDNLTLQYYDQNITYIDMVVGYNSLMTPVLEESYFVEQLIHEENSEGLSIVLNKTTAVENTYIIAFVSQWNVSETFYYEATISINYTFLRTEAQIEGLVLGLIGLVLIAVDQIIDIPKKKEVKEKDD